jgi:hypothetical protein
VNEPADLVLILGVAVPETVDTAVRRIIEEAVARLFVTVVLLPVTVTVPKESGLRPDDVSCVPSQLGRLDILHKVMI